jgi:hypothetical protein
MARGNINDVGWISSSFIDDFFLLFLFMERELARIWKLGN